MNIGALVSFGGVLLLGVIATISVLYVTRRGAPTSTHATKNAPAEGAPPS